MTGAPEIRANPMNPAVCCFAAFVARKEVEEGIAMKIRCSSLAQPNVAEDETFKLRPLIERMPRKKSWEEAFKEYEVRPKFVPAPASAEVETSPD